MNNKQTINLIFRGFLFKKNYLPISQRKIISKYYDIDFFTMGIDPYVYLITKLKEKYNVNVYFSTYDTVPPEVIQKTKQTFENAEILLCSENNSYQFTTTLNAIQQIKNEADFTVLLRADLILKKKFIDLIYDSFFDSNRILTLAKFEYKGIGLFDILHIIPKSLILSFENLLIKTRPKDLHRIYEALPTTTLCGKRTFHINCRSNKTGCAEFYTTYDGVIKNTTYNFTKETFRCHNLYITPENGVLSHDLINRMTNDRWEDAEARAIQHIDVNSCILDLGGCIGITSCLLNKKLSKPSHHVVLEANPRLIPTLTGIRDENLCKFHIENSLLGTESIDKIKFFTNPHHAMDGSIFPAKRRTIVENITQTTIPELERKYSISFDTIMSDIEGAEWSLWENILLNNNYFLKFKTIICEYHNIPANKILFDKINTIVRDYGYAIVQYSSQVYGFSKETK